MKKSIFINVFSFLSKNKLLKLRVLSNGVSVHLSYILSSRPTFIFDSVYINLVYFLDNSNFNKYFFVISSINCLIISTLLVYEYISIIILDILFSDFLSSACIVSFIIYVYA